MNTMNIYRILDGLFFIAILLTPAQTNNSSKADNDLKPAVEKTSELKSEEYKKFKKDSLFKAADKDIEASLRTVNAAANKLEELEEVKKMKRKAFAEHMKAVDELLKQRGRQEKIIVKTDLKQQLKNGEVFLEKDSICSNYSKGSLFRKKRCTDWKYSWYLVDKEGKTEKLW